MIDVINLKKSFGDVEVLTGIDITINKGDIVAVIGPSGSGKSTFLRCLNLLEVPTGGSIHFENVDITDKRVNIDIHRQKMGMVFQHFNLFNNKTVIENIMLAPVYVGKKRLKKHRKTGFPEGAPRSVAEVKAQARQRAMELLKRIGLEEKADAYPSQLSGGQKQRVAIVRSLAMDPDVILFDEPTSALDTKNAHKIFQLFKEISKDKLVIIKTKYAKNDEINFYANILLNYTIEELQLTTFYGYLIGEDIEDRDVRGRVSRFEYSPKFHYWFNPSEKVIYNMYRYPRTRQS